MADVSNKTIVALLAIALVVTVVGTVVSVGKLNTMGGRYAMLTGAATEGTGTASITVSGTAALVMNVSSISLYAGYYPTACSTGFSKIDTANLESSVATTTSCWVNTSGTDNQSRNRFSHRFANNGTTVINVKGQITASSTAGVSTLNATSILCGSANCPSQAANALIQIKAVNDESSTCTQGLNSSYTNLANITHTTNVSLCSRMEYDDSNDELNTTFILQIPKDADQGAKQFTITYYATAQ